MRKRLDEEMPERALFFWFKRGLLLVLLVLLSLGAFLLIRRTGERIRPAAGGTIVRAKDSGQGVDGLPGGDRQGEKEGDSRNRTTVEESGKLRPAEGSVRNRSGTRAAENAGKPRNAEPGQIRIGNTAQRNNISHAGANNKRTGTIGLRNEEPRNTESDHFGIGNKNTGNTKRGAVKTNDLQRTIIDPRLVQTESQDPIRVKVDMPRGAAPAGKKNAPKPEQSPKPATKPAKADSTRILWAAGLQDSKSFPVGAQQAYNYDANLKKDLWADYIPSPYFQYHISRKIAFQTALQLNNPQYTESVTIFRKAGDSSGGVQYINDTTVTVRKLYYFNIPFLVYYSPLRNLSLGAGLQFSNLSNGIAFQNNVVHHVGTSTLNDTVTVTTVINLKENRPAYNNLRRTDWRALFEMNYYWKRITLGLQYQQALGNYLYTPVEGSSGRDRNSSFNIYLRYNLWERRIKITPK